MSGLRELKEDREHVLIAKIPNGISRKDQLRRNDMPVGVYERTAATRKKMSESAKKRKSKNSMTHGMGKTSTYKSWCGMKSRCLNSKDKSWHHYGGRGITVCERWMKFENFYTDMGVKPNGLSIDRRDNDKGYYPGNCRWATPKLQARQNIKYMDIDGLTLSLSEWAVKIGTFGSFYYVGLI